MMITTTSRIEGKKLSEVMLSPQLRTKGILKTKGTLETFLCVQDASCITQEFAQSSVRLATKFPDTCLQEKVLVITALKDELRKLKGKALADNVVCKHTIDPEMLKIDVESLNPRLLNNRVKPSTSASGSQPSSNTNKDKIQRTPSSTQKNKVEAHPRTVKSSLKNKNSVVEPKGTANVQHSKHNANNEPLFVKCNDCMLFDNHDLCVLDFINDVNARTKSKIGLRNKVKREKFRNQQEKCLQILDKLGDLLVGPSL
ncbi:hypothetical protein Tco_1121522 [Tanacetum coccineum]|uniref:Uncharacterized protein n=1 Tax=Tanacetum coccineum TaxID=301880 RepID=A0ABQ5IY03_9ASTR